MLFLKFIGPFLRINILNNDNIKSQLFHLSKESLKHIVLYSGCGIICKNSDLRNKALPTDDDTTNSVISPLLCVYRKADGKLLQEKDKLIWNHRKFKKEINICSNGYMTLGLLYLSEYYRNFSGIDKDKFNLAKYYVDLASEQLEFYAINCRSADGLFIDKYDSSDPLEKDYNLTDKDIKFKFSTQALLMAAYYKCYTLSDKKRDDFKDFSLDILNLFSKLKREIRNTSQDELVKICLAFNIFYEASQLDEAREILVEFTDLMLENIKHMPPSVIRDNVDMSCLSYIAAHLAFKNTGVEKFTDDAQYIFEGLERLYDNERGVFIKDLSEKENKFSSDEILLYLYSFMIQRSTLKGNEQNELSSKIHNIYKNQVVNSGIILRWPEAPPLDDVERYKNFSNKSEDLLDDSYFRMANCLGTDSNNLAPIFVKSVSLNRKKESYKQYKSTFDSCKNMFNFFTIIYLNSTLDF